MIAGSGSEAVAPAITIRLPMPLRLSVAGTESVTSASNTPGLCWSTFDLTAFGHHVMVGLPLPSPRSVAGLLINEGIFGASPSEPVLDVLEKLKRRFGAATDALDACDREHRLSHGRRPTLLVYRVICSDEDAMHWREEDIGNLRVALNALVRVFRM